MSAAALAIRPFILLLWEGELFEFMHLSALPGSRPDGSQAPDTATNGTHAGRRTSCMTSLLRRCLRVPGIVNGVTRDSLAAIPNTSNAILACSRDHRVEWHYIALVGVTDIVNERLVTRALSSADGHA